MSDELTIQPGVNPQIQPAKTSTVPYALGGAVVGAGAGWGASALYKGKATSKTYEELIKDANEKDVVDLKAKKEALEKAEKDLEKAGKVVYDGKEKEELDKAIAARDKELARLTEEKTTSVSNEFKPKAWKNVNIDAKDLPTTNERTGEPFSTKNIGTWESQVKSEYNRLVADYNKAVSDLDAKLGSTDQLRLQNNEQSIKNYLDNTVTRRAKTGVEQLDDIFSTTEPSWRGRLGAHHAEFKEADKIAANIYPQISTKNKLTKNQITSFAEKLEDGATRPSGHNNTFTIKEVVDGRVKNVKYTFSDDMFNDFKASENKRILERQKELRESLLNSAKEYIKLKRKDVKNEFVQSIPDNIAKKSGFIDGSGKIDIIKIGNEAGGKPRFYRADISLINQAIEKNGGAHKSLPKGLKASYVGAKDLQEALDMATTRKQMLQDFVNECNDFKKSLENCYKDHSVLNELRDKIAETRNSDEAVAKAKEALFKQFPTLNNGSVSKTALSKEKAMEKESYKKLAKVVEEKQAIYDKVAAEKGKIDETAKKAAEDVKEKAKRELEELVNTLNSKVKGMSGGAKAAVIGGLAVVGGLIGAGIAKSKNKNAEAYATDIIA